MAASVRARAMSHRRLGEAGIRALAGSPAVGDAAVTLARSPYGRFLPLHATLPQAQRAVAEALLWNLRVLAGWAPPDGVRMLRALAGWFELANVDEHLRRLGSAEACVDPPFRLGALATAWPFLASAGSVRQLRAALAASSWRDPGTDDPRALALALRVAWAQRVSAGVPPARPWAAAGLALLVAREVTGNRPLPTPAAANAVAVLGRRSVAAASLAQLAAVLPADASWVLTETTAATGLWRAEVRWWSRLAADGLRLLTRPGFGPDTAVGAAALLAVDAWRTRAALEVVARQGTSVSRRVLPDFPGWEAADVLA